MYKSPILGRVKTRLGEKIGHSRALELYRWMGKRQLSVIPSDWEVEVRYSPDDSLMIAKRWLGNRPVLMSQGDGDLGERMSSAARSALENDGVKKLFLLGADCLAIDEEALRQAAARLDHSDYVVGPSTDGGYYLLGMTGYSESIFESIEWSSPTVLSTTRMRIQDGGLSLVEIGEESDIDDWESLLTQRERVDEMIWNQLGLDEFVSDKGEGN